MEEKDFILFCIKLFLGAASSFCAIIFLGKKRTAGVCSLCAFVLSFYAATVYQMLCSLGIVEPERLCAGIAVFGIPVLTLLFTTVPPALLTLALVFLILEYRKY